MHRCLVGFLVAAAWLGVCAAGAAAETLTATLSNVQFADRGTGNASAASGSFDFDPSTLQVSRSSVVLAYPWLNATVSLDDATDAKISLVGSHVVLSLSAPPQCGSTQDCTAASLRLQLPTEPNPLGEFALSCCGTAAGDDSLQINSATYTGGITSGSVIINGSGSAAGQLYLVSPFALGAPDLANIYLRSLLPAVTDWSTVAANGILAEPGATAIALWQTASPTDVTFASDNGTTLVPYNPHFLTKPPAAGTPSVTIPAAGLIPVGGTFYAAALVQGPADGVPVSFSAPVTVTVETQGATQAAAAIELVAPPVVLVHGLWGDATSLADLQNYLTGVSPWKQHPQLVQAIAYTNDIAFDAGEPAAVLHNLIATVIGGLDDAHVVGGRVDVVAHSMGGLVVRHFSGLPAYRGLRDRSQGKFHEIVTLDTPETGSELARYLLQNRGDTLQPFAPLIAQVLWRASCQPASLTVEQCFDNLGMPLGPAGHLREGALFSLIPGNPHLLNAPPPAIPDAVWRAVTAIVPQTDSFVGESELEFEEQQLIAATFPDPTRHAPTIAQILADHRQDDAIVTLASQMAGLPAGSPDYVTFPNMAHSPAQTAGILDLVLSNANVTQSGAVNKVVGCWLQTSGDPGCIATPLAEAAPLAAPANPPLDIGRLHPGAQLTVMPPPDVRLATPFALAITGAPPGLLRLVVRQRDALGRHAGPQRPKLTRASDGTLYAEVTPMLFGSVTFTIEALYADAGLSSQEVTTLVRLPDAPPELFLADANSRKIHIGLADGLNVYPLHPQAVYPGVPGRINLDGRVVDYRVLPGPGAAAVDLQTDPGDPARVELVGLQPGAATVEARLGSAVAHLRVVVEP
jgi:hypothetical protein